MVSIVAFQAIDPGSIPGQRIFYKLFPNFVVLHFLHAYDHYINSDIFLGCFLALIRALDNIEHVDHLHVYLVVRCQIPSCRKFLPTSPKWTSIV